VALSERVPFFLVQGYKYRGPPLTATGCLKLCEGFDLVEKDYPTAGHEKAARALTQTEEIRKLYEPQRVGVIAEMVFDQAKAPKEAGK
jgi:hypothetical protein